MKEVIYVLQSDQSLFGLCLSLCLWRGGRHEAECGYDARHEWADDIEEAERQIYECRYAEHGALRHAACRPRNKYRGDGGAVLGTTAEQLGTIATVLIFLTEDGGVHDDGEELVAHNHIEEHAACNGCADKAGRAVYGTQYNLRKAEQHVAGHHARAEEHGAEYEPYRIEHTSHTAC